MRSWHESEEGNPPEIHLNWTSTNDPNLDEADADKILEFAADLLGDRLGLLSFYQAQFIYDDEDGA